MSSQTVQAVIQLWGVRRVAEVWKRQGTDFETAHLLLLGCTSRKWLLFGTRRIFRCGAYKEVPHLITEQPFKQLVVTKFS